uniref:Uncharacterized protein n=1 Tax=Aegilops tauschii subsp. strangulata TaxID=200361 RepID=A0A453FL56_AEGTS
MDGKTPHLLPLSLSEAKKKIRDDVPLVCGWALLNAFATLCGVASGYIAEYIHVSCSQVTTYPCTTLRMFHIATDPSCAKLVWCSSAVLLHSAVHRADGRGGRQANRPLRRDAVLRPIPGGRGGAGAAAPMPASPGPPDPRLPRAGGHHPLPLLVRQHRVGLPRRRPRIHLRQDLLHRGLLLLRGGRPPQLPGPPGR